jgi:hypothetical protein
MGGSAGGQQRAAWLLAALLATVAFLLDVSGAGATTGGQPLEDLPIYGLTPAQATPFLGRFEAKGDGNQLISVSLRTEFTVAFQGRSVVQGMIAVDEYDAAGRPSTWVATTYEYHDVGDVMHIDIWTPDGKKLLGHLNLRLRSGELVGLMKTDLGTHRVAFRRRGAEPAPPEQAPRKRSTGDAPRAEGPSAELLSRVLGDVDPWMAASGQ